MSKSIKQFILDNQGFLEQQEIITYTTITKPKDTEAYESNITVKGTGVKRAIAYLLNRVDEAGYYQNITNQSVPDDVESIQLISID